ncbi:alpha-L-arabinofuranosidase [Niastella caeni]|uniref:Alpha-L-arabinofuranosidase n=1 Tax=Niastella caeni TaxID=2569763 RepID=A0A4S8HUP4_9BACT|nr:alpha-L-arabinofuranosidase [Niastella caeni]THU38369.1 alpha-L-arabinofuranosidase [Niastella caeni]
MSKSFVFVSCVLGCFCYVTGLTSCKKSVTNDDTNNPNPQDTTVPVVTPQDPSTANTIGFFMDEWSAKSFTPPSFQDGTVPAAAGATVNVDASTIVTKVPPTLFANNANTWMGNFTDATLNTHITNFHPHIIRFPGGSISDIFFWNAAKNVKPADAPDSLLNDQGVKAPGGYWYGKNTESWTCSVDNYYNMLQQTGNKGIITINYGYARYGTSTDPVAAAAHLAADWVRYDNGRTKYWEIGNESNGSWEAGYRIDVSKNKDGQPALITGDLYGRHVKVFVDSMRKAAQQIGKTIYIGATLVEHAPLSWEPTATQTWNTTALPQVNNAVDYYIVHNYYTEYQANWNATSILNTGSSVTKTMFDHVSQAVSSAGASMKPIALTEWNIFSEGSMQMVSSVAGMHAVLVIGELLKNKFGFAARWDLANAWNNGNDMGLFSNGDEPGVQKWNPRPAFYYMYYLQKCLGDRFVNSTVTGNSNIKSYATTFSSGQIGLTLVNTSTTAVDLQTTFKNFNAGSRYYWYSLTSGTDNGEFSRKVIVNGATTSGVAGGPDNYATLKPYSASAANGIKITVPARGVVCMVIDKK